MWGRLVDPSWIVEVSDDYQGYMEHNGFTQARMDYYSDYFQKNMAQAFGEEAHGDVYLLVDDDVYPNNDWNTASTWGGNVATTSAKTDANFCRLGVSRFDPQWQGGQYLPCRSFSEHWLCVNHMV